MNLEVSYFVFLERKGKRCINAAYITLDDAEVSGPLFVFADQLFTDRQSRLLIGKPRENIFCRTRLEGDWPAWFYPDGKLVPLRVFPNYPSERGNILTEWTRNNPPSTYFYQFISHHSSQLFLRAVSVFHQDTIPVGLFKCGVRDNDKILAVGVYLRHGNDKCKTVNCCMILEL